jgi:flagellar assembly factor FliW
MMSEQQQGTVEQALIALPEVGEQEFFFPEGLLGFPTYQHFVLSRYQPEDGSPSPFYLLQTKEVEVYFPLIAPQWIMPQYQLSVPKAVLAKLEAKTIADLIVLTIVTLRKRVEEATVNLQGPLLLNPVTYLGLQLVVERYPVRHALVLKQ